MSLLFDVRSKLSNIGTDELSIRENQPALSQLWQQMQELREEMNHAKKLASLKASEPYLETINDLEKKYAFLLKLIA